MDPAFAARYRAGTDKCLICGKSGARPTVQKVKTERGVKFVPVGSLCERCQETAKRCGQNL